jgi:hypothetical protein
MADVTKYQKGIIELDKQLNSATDPQERQRILDDMVVLSKAIKGSQTTETAPDPIDEVRGRAKVDPAGAGMAIVAGLNKGLVDIANLPFDLVNLVGNTVSNLTGVDMPKTATPQSAIDFISEQLTGFRPIEAATTPSARVDTATERVLNRMAEFGAGGYGTAGAIRAGAQRVSASQAPRAVPTLADRAGGISVGRETLEGTTAGLGFGAVEQISDNPYAQMAGALVGGISPAVAEGSFNVAKSTLAGFTDNATKQRVANTLVANTTDVESAINNLKTNKLLVEQTIPNAKRIPTTLMAQDEGLQRAVNAAVDNDNSLINILNVSTRNAQEELSSQLQGIAAKGSPQDFVAKINTVVRNQVDKLKAEADLARNTADKLGEQLQNGRPTTDISQDFVEALENSFKSVKKREDDLWDAVDKVEKIDTSVLKQKVNQLRGKLERTETSTTFPKDLFNEVNTFGGEKNTFQALNNYRSSVLEEIRGLNSQGKFAAARPLKELERVLAEVIDSTGTSSAHSAAAEYTRTVRGLYNKGKLGRILNIDTQGDKRIDPEVALSRVVRQGDNVGDVKKAIRAEQETPLQSGEVVPAAEGLTKNIEEYLFRKFAADTSKGKASFFKSFKPTLNKFPELSRDLARITDEIDILAQRSAQIDDRIATITDRKRTSVAALLGADPEDIYPSLKGLTREDLQNIKRVTDIENVTDGFQSVYIRQLVNKMLDEDNVVSRGRLAKLLNTDPNLNKGFSVVLNPSQRAALGKLQKVADILSPKDAGAKASDVKDLFSANPLTQILSRVIGVRVAGAVAPPGPGAIQTAAIFSRAAQKVANALPSSKSMRLIEQAVLEPKLMEELLLLGQKGKVTEKEAIDTILSFYARAGVQANMEEEQEDDYQGLTIEITRGNENAQ